MLTQLRVITGLLIAGVLVYAGLWYTAAFDAEEEVTRLLSSWRNKGLIVDHGRIDHGGFPYRITVTVDDITVESRVKGLSVKADSIQLISHLWTPRHWLIETTKPVITAADGAFHFEAQSLLTSYRVHETGESVIAFSSETADDATFHQLLGLPQPKLNDWSLFLKLASDTTTKSNSLYGKTQLDFKLGGRWLEATTEQDASLVLTGNITGTSLKDWTPKDLSKWAAEGGLVDIDHLEYLSGDTAATGNASLTIDDQLHFLGSGSLTVSKASTLYKALSQIGFQNMDTLPTDGQLSIMAQNGSLAVDATPLITLKSLFPK